MLAKASCGASWKTVELWSSIIHFLEIQVSPAVNAGEPGDDGHYEDLLLNNFFRLWLFGLTEWGFFPIVFFSVFIFLPCLSGPVYAL